MPGVRAVAVGPASVCFTPQSRALRTSLKPILASSATMRFDGDAGLGCSLGDQLGDASLDPFICTQPLSMGVVMMLEVCNLDRPTSASASACVSPRPVGWPPQLEVNLFGTPLGGRAGLAASDLVGALCVFFLFV